MKLLKAFKLLTWAYLIFCLVVWYYDWRKNQFNLENLTMLMPLMILVTVDYIEQKHERKNVNNNWSDSI